MADPIQVRTYTGASPEETVRRFEEDARKAAANGYRPSIQTWRGSSLTVTYQLGPPAPPTPAPKKTFKDRPLWQRIVAVLVILVVGASIFAAITRPSSRTGAPTTTSTTRTPSANATPRPAASTPRPAPPAAAFADIRLSGNGASVEPFTKPAGTAAIVELQHTGSSNFAVHSIDSAGNNNDLLVNVIGRYSGTVLLDASGNSSALRIEADGGWTAIIRPVTEARAWNGAGALSGNGDDVVLLSPPTSGLVTLDLTHSGESNFAVFSLSDSGLGLLVNEIGRYTGQVLLPNGTVLLQVNADGAWTGTPG